MNKFLLLIFFSVFIQIHGQRKCRDNEELKLCGRICEETCFSFIRKELTCFYDEKECNKNTEDCRCKQGYIRDESTGTCVRPNHCSKCDYGESYLPCGKLCEASCQSPVVPKICNHAICGRSDCRCNFEAGFLRDYATGKCVLLKKCSQKSLL